MQHSVFLKSFLPSDWGEKVSLPQTNSPPFKFLWLFLLSVKYAKWKAMVFFLFFSRPLLVWVLYIHTE